MFLHLHIPSFHAAVHQALDSRLHGQPVAVAVDAGDQAALFDVSREAAAARVWPGLRVAAARRRCPRLHVVTPRPEWYHRAHGALLAAAVAAAPRVGGRSGSLDVDLSGTEAVWRRASGSADSQLQARWWALRLQAHVSDQLHLPVSIGVAGRLRIARLAALAARSTADEVCAVVLGAELPTIAPWPIRWCRELSLAALRSLAACGIETIGALAALPPSAVHRLLGPEADLPLTLLSGEDEPPVPVLDTPAREVAVIGEAGVAGADAEQAERLVTSLARDLGFRLRMDGVACSRLTLHGTWLDGRTATRSQVPSRQLCHDDELARVAIELLRALTRRVAWERLGLTASGILPAEHQEELFLPPRVRRMEGARDHLRRRFGTDVVAAATAVVRGAKGQLREPVPVTHGQR